MGQRFPVLEPKHREFIAAQKIFFVATAGAVGRVNLSPKGMDTLRVLDAQTIHWLNLTGSGNETAAHLREHPRMTLMWCAFAGPPLILRVYGEAHAVHRGEDGWDTMAARFEAIPGARQIFVLKIDLVQTSCGFAVPRMAYEEDRSQLRAWAEHKGPGGIAEYWKERNAQSLDGRPTGIESALEPSP